MDILALVQSIEATAVGEWLRTSVKAMPFVEALHVLAAATVFGTVLVVDLRLLGALDAHRPFTRVSHELMRWTWTAFVVAALTGAAMFAANAVTYYHNTAFKLKLVALLAAGLNMGVFEGLTAKTATAWNDAARTPSAARTAAALSILIWVTVIFLARWIGFTKGYDFKVPDNIDFNFQ